MSVPPTRYYAGFNTKPLVQWGVLQSFGEKSFQVLELKRDTIVFQRSYGERKEACFAKNITEIKWAQSLDVF